MTAAISGSAHNFNARMFITNRLEGSPSMLNPDEESKEEHPSDEFIVQDVSDDMFSKFCIYHLVVRSEELKIKNFTTFPWKTTMRIPPTPTSLSKGYTFFRVSSEPTQFLTYLNEQLSRLNLKLVVRSREIDSVILRTRKAVLRS